MSTTRQNDASGAANNSNAAFTANNTDSAANTALQKDATTLRRRAVSGIAGDKRINYAMQQEQRAEQEQDKREALTSLKMADVLKINEDNRPLPSALRQSRSLYHGGVSSGFSDPITNPFSKFVYKAKADQYYVTPTESVNSFRRQKARQDMINLAMKEKLLYPLAAQQLSKKKQKVGTLPEVTHPMERVFRPSNLLVRNGVDGLQHAHQRYYKLPQTTLKSKKTHTVQVDKNFQDRVNNYVTSNHSFHIKDVHFGSAFRPFEEQRVLQ